jgi:FAD binding domain
MSNLASFEQALKGDIVTPADADYPAAISRWALNAQQNAQIIAFVKDAEDVVLAINYARDSKLPLAVRGGGHSPGGSSSTEGLVIDLSRYINGVTIDAENKLAIVGGGAVWETVDKAAIKHELATVGGTVNHVSILCIENTFFLTFATQTGVGGSARHLAFSNPRNLTFIVLGLLLVVVTDGSAICMVWPSIIS